MRLESRQNLPHNWILYLDYNSRVYLCKENEIAYTQSLWDSQCVNAGSKPPVGRLKLKREFSSEVENWFVRSDGTGIDGSDIIQPFRGELSDVQVADLMCKADDRTLDDLTRQIRALALRIDYLSSRLLYLETQANNKPDTKYIKWDYWKSKCPYYKRDTHGIQDTGVAI